MGDRRALDLLETVPGEEASREREHEYPRDAHLPGTVQQGFDQTVPHAVALAALVHRHRADLGQVLPHHVQCPAPHHLAVTEPLGDPEFLDVLIQVDGGLAQHPAGGDVVGDQAGDGPDVAGAGPPDDVLHRPHTLAAGPGWAVAAGPGWAAPANYWPRRRLSGLE